MSIFHGKTALVTGASRGVGRGVALGLGEAGATVYVTGRTVNEDSAVEGLPGTIMKTAEEIDTLGGRGVPVVCDHRNDDAVTALFDKVMTEQGGLDILVNSVWGGYEQMVTDGQYTWEQPFWEQPLWRWEAMFQAGVRAYFTAARLAARIMTAQTSGLIVNISFWAARKFMANTIYGTSKAAVDKMTSDMAHELESHHVAVVALYPGLVRTERIIRAVEYGAPLDLAHSESPRFIGRAVVGMAADQKVMTKSGMVLTAADLAMEYGFTDIDGQQPRPLSLDDV